MARPVRFRRKERPPEELIHDPEFQEEVEERARYGQFAIYMAVGLTIAVLVAIIAGVWFIPQWT